MLDAQTIPMNTYLYFYALIDMSNICTAHRLGALQVMQWCSCSQVPLCLFVVEYLGRDCKKFCYANTNSVCECNLLQLLSDP